MLWDSGMSVLIEGERTCRANCMFVCLLAELPAFWMVKFSDLWDDVPTCKANYILLFWFNYLLCGCGTGSDPLRLETKAFPDSLRRLYEC